MSDEQALDPPLELAAAKVAIRRLIVERDIVRQLHGAADRASLVCTKTGNFQAAMIDAAHLRAAANEIERLRVIVQGWEHSARNAERDMETLRAERDEARREVCRCLGNPPIVNIAEGIATERGWDCFKENNNDKDQH